ncbi:MAG: ATP-binding protein [Thermoguttaceae bacterium]
MESTEPTAKLNVERGGLRRHRNDTTPSRPPAVGDVARPREPVAAELLATAVLDQTQDAIVVCDLSGRVVRANRAADQLCGCNSVTQPFDVAFPLQRAAEPSKPGDSPGERLPLLPSVSTFGHAHDVEASLVRADGLRIELLVNASQMRDGNRRPVATLVTMTDITSRKQAEAELRRSKEEWERVLDTAPDLVAIFDEDHVIVRANHALADRLGMTQEQLAGMTCYEAIHGTSEPPEWCPHSMTHGDGREHTAEMYEPRLGGYFLVSTSPRFDSQGRVIGTIHIARDVTERKRREKQIDTLTRIYAVLSEVNETLIRVHDPDTVFSEVCRIITDKDRFPLAWIGLPRGQQVVPIAAAGPAASMLQEVRIEVAGPLGAGPTGTCIRENRPVINNDFAANPMLAPWSDVALRHGVRMSAAFPLRHQGEAIGSLTIYASDANSFDAEHIGLLESLSADISYTLDVIEHDQQRLRAEEALRVSAEELARSNQDLEQFASIASHDLQEPLRTVAGFVELLRKKYIDHLDTEANTFIEFVVEGTRRMQTLIRDLLAYSRVGTRHREPIPTNSADSLRQVLDDLYESIQQVGAEVTYGELPTVRADPSQLAQLFLNLIGNALKFRSETPPKVHIDARRDGEYWRFSVSDNGIGIAPKYFDQIFEVFRRLHTREHYEGTGIGLAICKKIVDRHGGRIWVESQLGQGATFYFTLPA